MECLRKKQTFVTFKVWLYEKQVDSRDVTDMSNLFYFHFVFIWSRGMTRLPRSILSKRNGMNKIIWNLSVFSRGLQLEGEKMDSTYWIVFTWSAWQRDHDMLGGIFYFWSPSCYVCGPYGLWSEDKIFLICHVATQLKFHLTLWVRFPHPKLPPY